MLYRIPKEVFDNGPEKGTPHSERRSSYWDFEIIGKTNHSPILQLGVFKKTFIITMNTAIEK